VQLAAGGHDAIAYLQGQGPYSDRSQYEFPSYILTDLQMPEGDGFHVLQFIKENPALSIIPVVMLSNSDDTDDIRHAYLLGASSYFVKPLDIPSMRKLLKKIHDYWIECEVPEVDAAGYATPTDSTGRPGARYKKPKR
jgi:CheY-like chemotaxis protein